MFFIAEVDWKSITSTPENITSCSHITTTPGLQSSHSFLPTIKKLFFRARSRKFQPRITRIFVFTHTKVTCSFRFFDGEEFSGDFFWKSWLSSSGRIKSKGIVILFNGNMFRMKTFDHFLNIIFFKNYNR